MAQDWNIQRRAERCSVSGRDFQEGEYFYTLLFREDKGLCRVDWSEEVWKERGGATHCFSYWRTRFERPPAAAPEALPRQGAEDLLRRLMLEDLPEHQNARYILALMLERKKVLRPVDEKPLDDGRLLVYEHGKTGEIFLIHDPMLRMDQVEAVQDEVFALLSGGSHGG